MSHSSLQEFLRELLETKKTDSLRELFTHSDFRAFMHKHVMKMPVEDLSVAFVHRSFSHEFNVPHQEQLEFLGDAVLQLILTDELYRRFPLEKEGQLSKLRSALVNEKSLATIANGLRLGSLIVVGKGEFKKQLFTQDVVLADTLEALLGQVYRHQGLDVAKKLFLSWLSEFIPKAFAPDFLLEFDSKSQLQERVLAKYKKLPKYTSKDVANGFEITLWINDVIEAQGVFTSKQSGEKELAKLALKKETF
jgi:ribonuclease-3